MLISKYGNGSIEQVEKFEKEMMENGYGHLINEQLKETWRTDIGVKYL